MAFIAASIVLLYLNLRRGTPVFYYDADIYWNLRLEFDQQKTVPFSLLNYSASLRGYLYPLFNYGISLIAGWIGVKDVLLLQIVQALVYAALISVVIPGIIEMLFHQELRWWQPLLFSALVIFFWNGFLYYPLSDFVAVLLVATGVYLFLRFRSHWWPAILVGMGWGGTALVRPIYEITLLPLLLWAVDYYRWEMHLQKRQILVRLLALVLGMGLVFGPQTAINLVHFNILSPFVQTQMKYGREMYALDLAWGIVIQKYEGNIGSNYPGAGAYFLDRQGISVLVRSGLASQDYAENPLSLVARPSSLGEYFGLVLRYPLDFLGIYMRHLFNGLDLVYDTEYVPDLYQRSLMLSFANYSIWFLVIAYAASKMEFRNIVASRCLLPLIVALPAAAAIPTTIEVRYMLPLQLMAYALTAFWILPGFASLSGPEKWYVIRRYGVLYIAFLALCFMLSANAYMGLQFGFPTLTGG